MSEINYNDLYKIYHHEQLNLPEKKKKIKPQPQPQPQPQPLIIVEEKQPINELVDIRAMLHDLICLFYSKKY